MVVEGTRHPARIRNTGRLNRRPVEPQTERQRDHRDRKRSGEAGQMFDRPGSQGGRLKQIGATGAWYRAFNGLSLGSRGTLVKVPEKARPEKSLGDSGRKKRCVIAIDFSPVREMGAASQTGWVNAPLRRCPRPRRGPIPALQVGRQTARSARRRTGLVRSIRSRWTLLPSPRSPRRTEREGPVAGPAHSAALSGPSSESRRSTCRRR